MIEGPSKASRMTRSLVPASAEGGFCSRSRSRCPGGGQSGAAETSRRFCSAAMTHLGRRRPAASGARGDRRSAGSGPKIRLSRIAQDAETCLSQAIGTSRGARTRSWAVFAVRSLEVVKPRAACGAFRRCCGVSAAPAGDPRNSNLTCYASASWRNAYDPTRRHRKRGDSRISTPDPAFPQISTSFSLHNAYYTQWSNPCAWDASQVIPDPDRGLNLACIPGSGATPWRAQSGKAASASAWCRSP